MAGNQDNNNQQPKDINPTDTRGGKKKKTSAEEQITEHIKPKFGNTWPK